MPPVREITGKVSGRNAARKSVQAREGGGGGGGTRINNQGSASCGGSESSCGC